MKQPNPNRNNVQITLWEQKFKTMKNELLQFAVDDNIEWCTTVCQSHQADIHLSKSAWLNRKPSPRYYPDIITREPQAQAATLKAIDQFRTHNPTRGLGVKDSYGDIDLKPQGFSCVLTGEWYGGHLPSSKQITSNDWQTVQSTDELEQWEIAWGGDTDNRIFKSILLFNPRIKFWFFRENGNIHSGFISFHSGKNIGISNWFAPKDSIFELSLSKNIAPYFGTLPIVYWLAENEEINLGTTASPLGSMRVWIIPNA